MKGYIINVEQIPLGHIKIYDTYDVPRITPFSGSPKSLGVFDIFIGEGKYLGRDLGSQATSKPLRLYGSKHSHIFVDPESTNIAAIKSYEKAGFTKVDEYMLRSAKCC
ncbi:GNAT family N-acetyltransferase [Pajaroellobacter abortibovis]|uniref:GNAT family N-acetyltransferase n=1 Tax=Pajaroellobacter abortibovis TaxID=1882918 RepID=UPI0009F9A29A